MKIRNGFVSNSSSSSFVVRVGEGFSSVSEVALYIIETIEKEWGDGKFEDEKSNLKQLSDPDIPVYIGTGDETYIRKYPEKNGDVILITTTQNCSFDKIESAALGDTEISEELYNDFHHEDEEYPEDSYTPNCVEDLTYYYKKFNDFLILKQGFFGRHEYFHEKDKIKHQNNCYYKNSNFTRGWLLKSGEKICDCQVDRIVRKTKLNNINENGILYEPSKKTQKSLASVMNLTKNNSNLV